MGNLERLINDNLDAVVNLWEEYHRQTENNDLVAVIFDEGDQVRIWVAPRKPLLTKLVGCGLNSKGVAISLSKRADEASSIKGLFSFWLVAIGRGKALCVPITKVLLSHQTGQA